MSAAGLTLVASLVAAAAAATGCRLARGTTAVPAAAWAIAAAGALAAEAGCRAAGWLTEPAAMAATRLVVAAVAVCPAASLLGAKRPQHGVWQLIVATLAGVLMLPAAAAALVRPGSMPDVHLIERGLLAVLVAVGWLNFVATRHGLAATVVAAGQAAVLWPVVAGGGESAGVPAWLDAAGSLAVAGGGALAVGQSLRPPAPPAASAAAAVRAIDPAFLALRETLGAAWTLRIAERFNSLAAVKEWPCRLHFAGLEMVAGPSGRKWERDAVRSCRSILRRFVSVDWLERQGGMRLPEVRHASGGSPGPSVPPTGGPR